MNDTNDALFNDAALIESLEKCDAFIKRMKEQGNLDDILAGLTHRSALVRINGIMNAARHSIKTPEVIRLIQNLKDDYITFDTYSVSEFATAALDILGAEKYNGNEEHILNLIESKFDF